MAVMFQDLWQIGKLWHGWVWLNRDVEKRRESRIEICAFFNITVPDFTINRGFQNYDPVIRYKGKARKYLDIAMDLDKDPQKNAESLLLFFDGAKELAAMPPALQELCVIVSVAEVGRGYDSYLFSQLIPFAEQIKAGLAMWADIKGKFSPSLTYSEDSGKDWDDPNVGEAESKKE